MGTVTSNVTDRPALSPEDVAAFVRQQYGLDGVLAPLPSERDQNARLETGEGDTYVVKVANQGDSAAVLDFQNAAMARLSRLWAGGAVPRVIRTATGDALPTIRVDDGREFCVRVLTFLHGQPLSDVPDRSGETLERLGRALGELDRCLADFRHPAMRRDLRWDLRRAEWIGSETRCVADVARRGIIERVLLQYRARVVPLLPDLPLSVIHNDANDENVLLVAAPGGGWKVSGLLDFGDMLWSHTVNELAVGCAYAILGAGEPVGLAASVVAGYHRARPLTDLEVRVLFPLIGMRLCLSVTMSAVAALEDPLNAHAQLSDRLAWEMLEGLEPVDWREAEGRFRDACGLGPRHSPRAGRRNWTDEGLLAERRTRTGPSLSLSYATPLQIVRGRGQFLFGPRGRAYLDCVNNVCHVGHCHPRVVEALSRQAATLNTNTRYLHPSLVEYAARLTRTFPDPLRVCFFVNSGSEANELAVRLARAHTGRHDVVVVDGAYHGNTTTLVALSPYKCEGPGGHGLPDWVQKVSRPDPYRGPHRGGGEAVGKAYAEDVRDACARLIAARRPPALFLCESILACGGQIVLPAGYLEEAFRHVRAAGALCVVDEVQVGLGRVGSHMWAFQTQGVIPDIVTLGKPIGNGHPIGAVITTPEIAASFANGMEFFSTFGGNPVSCAVGMAVMDVMETEGLQARAARVGAYLANGFRALAEHHAWIGDVRALGLFMGVELVRDRRTRAPAPEETQLVIESAKADGVLLSAEGPYHNVLKVKPPLQFLEADADLLLGAVDRALPATSSRSDPR